MSLHKRRKVSTTVATWTSIVALLIHSPQLLGQFTTEFSTNPPVAGLEIAENSLSLAKFGSAPASTPPILTAELVPNSTGEIDGERFEIGSLNVFLADDISSAEQFTTALRIGGLEEPFETFLTLRFRLPSPSSGHGASVELIGPHSLALYGQEPAQQLLALELVSSSAEPEQEAAPVVTLAPGNNQLTLFGSLRSLPRVRAQVDAQFVNATGPPTMVIDGIGSPTVNWGRPWGDRERGNNYTIETSAIDSKLEVPFLLSTFDFYNSTIHTSSLLSGLELELSLTYDGQQTSKDVIFHLGYQGTLNSSDLIASADIIEIGEAGTGESIPGTDEYLHLRFVNPSFSGFTQGRGFGAMEDQGATAEVWGILSKQQHLSPQDLVGRFELIDQLSNTQTQAQWKRGPHLNGANATSLDIYDYNGDTLADIAMVTRKETRLWLGQTNGQAFQQGETFPHANHGSAVFGDFNNDGTRDIAKLGDKLIVGFNNGLGEFTQSTQELTGSTGGDIAMGDLDGDDDLDFVVAMFDSASLVTFLNRGDGTFEETNPKPLGEDSPGSALQRINIALGDFDNDGDSDLAIARVDGVDYGFGQTDDTATGDIWFNNGAGEFESVQQGINHGAPIPLIVKSNFGNDIAITDINNDGNLDVVMPSYVSFSDNNGILLNLGNGFFAPLLPPNLGKSASKIYVGDLDGDGLTDIVANGHATATNSDPSVSRSSGVSVRLGTAPFSYLRTQALSEESPSALAFGDVNEDGQNDILVATGKGLELWLRDLSSGRSFAPGAFEPATIEDPVVRDVIATRVGKPEDSLTRLDLSLIRDLTFTRNGLSELHLPNGLINLEVLSLSHNSITEIYLPSDITKLKELYHSNPSGDYHPGVTSLTLGPGFQTLETLGLLGLGVQELHFESTMPHLKTIGLWANRVRDFSFLAMTPALETLNLGDNGIRTLTIPFGLSQLNSLTLSMNPIREVRIPRGMVINELHGFASSRIEEYDPQPIVLAPILHPDRGFVFGIISTDGPVSIDWSTNISAWKNHSQIEVVDGRAEFAIPLDKAAKSVFFKAYRR